MTDWSRNIALDDVPAATPGSRNTEFAFVTDGPLLRASNKTANFSGAVRVTSSTLLDVSHCGLTIVCDSATPINVTLPATLPVPGVASWFCKVQNIGAGVVTIVRNGLTINGGTVNPTVATNQAVLVDNYAGGYSVILIGGVVLTDPLTFKGVIDCSGNPNYPAADAGDVYRVSVAGKIGGGSGVNVEVADILLCIVDGTISGNQATVGADWTIMQANLDGAVIGPASATDGHLALFDGPSGKIIKDGGAPVVTIIIKKITLSIDGGGSVVGAGFKCIQLDYAGTIIGWSIEADQAGSISVAVEKHTGTQFAPVVTTAGDKISATAPIALASAQTAGVDASGVSTWTTAVGQWDSIGFRWAAGTTLTWATLWLRIQQ